MTRNTPLDIKIASLADIGVMRGELQQALSALRNADDPCEVMDRLAGAALVLMGLVFERAGRKRPSDDLYSCSEAANQAGLLPQQIFFLLGGIRDWSNKSGDAAAERASMAASRAEIHIAILLEAVVWYCCEYKKGPHLPPIHREEGEGQHSALSMKIASLADIGVMRDELQRAAMTLTENPIGVMNGLSRTALVLLTLLFNDVGRKRPSDNLNDCCEVALSLNLIPRHIYLSLGSIRVWANKADHAVEQVNLTASRAEIHLALMLEAVAWYYCEHKDWSGRSAIYREEDAGSPNAMPPQSEGAFVGYWPFFTGECVGREDCLAEALQALAAHRALTLIGGPGYGKTRAAWEYADRNKAAYPGGLFFANLTTLPAGTDSRSLSLYLGPTLQALSSSGEASLLVLDNCEHLAGIVAQEIQRLRRAQPQLHILATSRTALDNLQSFTVSPLPIPEEADDEAGVLDCETIEEYGAVDLFMKRARLVEYDFAMDAGNAELILAVCRKVGGIPFALELVAKLVGLRLEDILESLEDWLPEEAEGKDLAATEVRHGTVDGCVRWSINLLPENTRQFLYRASIFRGGFSLDAYRDVVLGRLEAAAPDRSWGGAVLELRKHGLITKEANNLYEMPGPVRQFALNQLKKDPDYPALRASYDEWLEAQPQLPTLRFIGQQQDDKIHLAVANAEEAVKVAEAVKDPYRAATIRSQGAFYLMISGRLFQGSKLLRQSLEYLPDYRQCEVRLGIGMYMYLRCEFQEALEYTCQSAELAERVGNTGIRVLAMSSQGVLEGFVSGPNPEASDRLDAAIELSIKDGDKWTIAYAHLSKGTYLWHADRLEEAERCYLTALKGFEAAGDKILTVFALNSLGHLARVAGRFGQAADYYLRSMKLSQGVLFERGRCGCVLGTSGMAIGLHQDDDAIVFWGAAQRQYKRMGVEMIPPIKRCYLAKFGALREATEAKEPGKYMRLYGQGERLTLPQAFKRAQEFLLQVQKSERRSGAATFMPSSKI